MVGHLTSWQSRRYRPFLRLTSLLIIQAFLAFDIAWAGPLNNLGSATMRGEAPAQTEVAVGLEERLKNTGHNTGYLLRIARTAIAPFLIAWGVASAAFSQEPTPPTPPGAPPAAAAQGERAVEGEASTLPAGLAPLAPYIGESRMIAIYLTPRQLTPEERKAAADLQNRFQEQGVKVLLGRQDTSEQRGIKKEENGDLVIGRFTFRDILGRQAYSPEIVFVDPKGTRTWMSATGPNWVTIASDHLEKRLLEEAKPAEEVQAPQKEEPAVVPAAAGKTVAPAAAAEVARPALPPKLAPLASHLGSDRMTVIYFTPGRAYEGERKVANDLQKRYGDQGVKVIFGHIDNSGRTRGVQKSPDGGVAMNLGTFQGMFGNIKDFPLIAFVDNHGNTTTVGRADGDWLGKAPKHLEARLQGLKGPAEAKAPEGETPEEAAQTPEAKPAEAKEAVVEEAKTATEAKPEEMAPTRAPKPSDEEVAPAAAEKPSLPANAVSNWTVDAKKSRFSIFLEAINRIPGQKKPTVVVIRWHDNATLPPEVIRLSGQVNIVDVRVDGGSGLRLTGKRGPVWQVALNRGAFAALVDPSSIERPLYQPSDHSYRIGIFPTRDGRVLATDLFTGKLADRLQEMIDGKGEIGGQTEAQAAQTKPSPKEAEAAKSEQAEEMVPTRAPEPSAEEAAAVAEKPSLPANLEILSSILEGKPVTVVGFRFAGPDPSPGLAGLPQDDRMKVVSVQLKTGPATGTVKGLPARGGVEMAEMTFPDFWHNVDKDQNKDGKFVERDTRVFPQYVAVIKVGGKPQVYRGPTVNDLKPYLSKAFEDLDRIEAERAAAEQKQRQEDAAKAAAAKIRSIVGRAVEAVKSAQKAAAGKAADEARAKAVQEEPETPPSETQTQPETPPGVQVTSSFPWFWTLLVGAGLGAAAGGVYLRVRSLQKKGATAQPKIAAPPAAPPVSPLVQDLAAVLANLAPASVAPATAPSATTGKPAGEQPIPLAEGRAVQVAEGRAVKAGQPAAADAGAERVVVEQVPASDGNPSGMVADVVKSQEPAAAVVGSALDDFDTLLGGGSAGLEDSEQGFPSAVTLVGAENGLNLPGVHTAIVGAPAPDLVTSEVPAPIAGEADARVVELVRQISPSDARLLARWFIEIHTRQGDPDRLADFINTTGMGEFRGIRDFIGAIRRVGISNEDAPTLITPDGVESAIRVVEAENQMVQPPPAAPIAPAAEVRPAAVEAIPAVNPVVVELVAKIGADRARQMAQWLAEFEAKKAQGNGAAKEFVANTRAGQIYPGVDRSLEEAKGLGIDARQDRASARSIFHVTPDAVEAADLFRKTMQLVDTAGPEQVLNAIRWIRGDRFLLGYGDVSKALTAAEQAGLTNEQLKRTTEATVQQAAAMAQQERETAQRAAAEVALLEKVTQLVRAVGPDQTLNFVRWTRGDRFMLSNSDVNKAIVKADELGLNNGQITADRAREAIAKVEKEQEEQREAATQAAATAAVVKEVQEWYAADQANKARIRERERLLADAKERRLVAQAGRQVRQKAEETARKDQQEAQQRHLEAEETAARSQFALQDAVRSFLLNPEDTVVSDALARLHGTPRFNTSAADDLLALQAKTELLAKAQGLELGASFVTADTLSKAVTAVRSEPVFVQRWVEGVVAEVKKEVARSLRESGAASQLAGVKDAVLAEVQKEPGHEQLIAALQNPWVNDAVTSTDPAYRAEAAAEAAHETGVVSEQEQALLQYALWTGPLAQAGLEEKGAYWKGFVTAAAIAGAAGAGYWIGQHAAAPKPQAAQTAPAASQKVPENGPIPAALPERLIPPGPAPAEAELEEAVQMRQGARIHLPEGSVTPTLLRVQLPDALAKRYAGNKMRAFLGTDLLYKQGGIQEIPRDGRVEFRVHDYVEGSENFPGWWKASYGEVGVAVAIYASDEDAHRDDFGIPGQIREIGSARVVFRLTDVLENGSAELEVFSTNEPEPAPGPAPAPVMPGLEPIPLKVGATFDLPEGSVKESLLQVQLPEGWARLLGLHGAVAESYALEPGDVYYPMSSAKVSADEASTFKPEHRAEGWVEVDRRAAETDRRGRPAIGVAYFSNEAEKQQAAHLPQILEALARARLVLAITDVDEKKGTAKVKVVHVAPPPAPEGGLEEPVVLPQAGAVPSATPFVGRLVEAQIPTVTSTISPAAVEAGQVVVATAPTALAEEPVLGVTSTLPYQAFVDAGEAIRPLRRLVDPAKLKTAQTPYLLYHRASLASLFFLYLPAGSVSPVVAVVEQGDLKNLRLMAQSAGFSKKEIDDWQETYVVPYGGDTGQDIFGAGNKAMERLSKLPGVQIQSVKELYYISQTQEAFGSKLIVTLGAFGLSALGEQLSPQMSDALERAHAA